MINAEVNTRNIALSAVTNHNTVYNTNYAICTNHKPTSTEVKCSLPSTLTNFKSIKAISLNVPSGMDLFTITANLYIDHDYAVAANVLPKAKGRMIHIEGDAHFLISGNAIVEHDLKSAKIINSNNIETIIPPSSCFNLTLTETITTLEIPFTADAKLKIASTSSSGFTTSDIPLSGTITANVIEFENSEVSPCIL